MLAFGVRVPQVPLLHLGLRHRLPNLPHPPTTNSSANAKSNPRPKGCPAASSTKSRRKPSPPPLANNFLPEFLSRFCVPTLGFVGCGRYPEPAVVESWVFLLILSFDFACRLWLS